MQMIRIRLCQHLLVLVRATPIMKLTSSVQYVHAHAQGAPRWPKMKIQNAPATLFSHIWILACGANHSNLRLAFMVQSVELKYYQEVSGLQVTTDGNYVPFGTQLDLESLLIRPTPNYTHPLQI